MTEQLLTSPATVLTVVLLVGRLRRGFLKVRLFERLI